MIPIIKDYKLKLKASIIHCGEKTLKDIGNPKMPLVTIYTPVKNSADRLNKTISSVINQDYKNHNLEPSFGKFHWKSRILKIYPSFIFKGTIDIL